MAHGYTVFMTYLLKSSSGYSPAIHCNYIKSLQLDSVSPDLQEVRFYFSNVDDFKFLNNGNASGSGYTANYFYSIIQLVNNAPFASIDDVKPNPALWKIIDITDQIYNHQVPGALILPSEISGPNSRVYTIPLNNYNALSGYSLNTNINGIAYPSDQSIDDDKLCFGDEEYFLGNVTTEIQAKVYTTNIQIPLALAEFNSSTNGTWNGQPVFISEVGIYDSDNNLVAIGKFNDPVEKNSNISRTILFAIDF